MPPFNGLVVAGLEKLQQIAMTAAVLDKVIPQTSNHLQTSLHIYVPLREHLLSSR